MASWHYFSEDDGALTSIGLSACASNGETLWTETIDPEPAP